MPAAALVAGVAPFARLRARPHGRGRIATRACSSRGGPWSARARWGGGAGSESLGDDDDARSLARGVASALLTHGVDARSLDSPALAMLRLAGVSTDALLGEAATAVAFEHATVDDPNPAAEDDASAAFAEWSRAFAEQVAPSMRAHGVDASKLDRPAADILIRAGVSPEWVAWYQSQLPPQAAANPEVVFDDPEIESPASASSETDSFRESPASSSSMESFRESSSSSSSSASVRADGMTLLDEADSEFGKLQVFRVDDDHRDRSFAGATVLMRAHTPDAVLSEYRPGVATTGGVFDLFAMLPPLVAHQPPAYPIGILGLGAGTCAREYAQFYPDDRRRMVGWELDPVIVDVARRHFGLGELEASGRLIARAGDGFEEIRRASREGRLLAGIIVDVFDEKSRVLPELTREETWLDVARALAPGGRVVANLSTGRGRGADLDAAVAAAECAAMTCGNGKAMLWRSGAMGIYNEVVITGAPPMEWNQPGALPSQLRKYAGEWYAVEAPPGKTRGWIMGG